MRMGINGTELAEAGVTDFAAAVVATTDDERTRTRALLRSMP